MSSGNSLFFLYCPIGTREPVGGGREEDLVYKVNKFFKITLKRMDSQDKYNTLEDKTSQPPEKAHSYMFC